MHPILFEIPVLGFPIRSFGLMVVLGFLLGNYLFGRLGVRYSDHPRRDYPGYAAVPLWILGGILIGARMMYVIVEIFQKSEVGQRYLDDPLSVFFYWEGGLVMYGGCFGGIFLGLWAAKRHGLRLAHSLDLGMISGFFGLAIGRIGCLLVGDDFGQKVTGSARDLPFPIVVHVPEKLPDGSLFGNNNAGEILWATQPWMSINAVLMGAVGLFFLRRRRYAGQVTLILLVLYSVARFTIESFRGDAVRGMWFDDALSTSQLVSIVLGSISLVVLLLWARRTEENRGFPFLPTAENPHPPEAPDAGVGEQAGG